ncbi:MAG TPA: PA2779 family protein [Gammaproteobacteria bacterium]|nr:PA2779 family protein [Gammaproteobacteria bacterium]
MMDSLRHGFHWLKTLLAIALLGTAVAIPTANAAMIGTQVLANHQSADQARAKLNAMLERDDVQQQLHAMGVSPAEAQMRVAALSDSEARHIANRIDQMPAGGTSILGAILLVFLVLLFTDIMGWTDVFPFVKKTVR